MRLSPLLDVLSSLLDVKVPRWVVRHRSRGPAGTCSPAQHRLIEPKVAVAHLPLQSLAWPGRPIYLERSGRGSGGTGTTRRYATGITEADHNVRSRCDQGKPQSRIFT